MKAASILLFVLLTAYCSKGQTAPVADSTLKEIKVTAKWKNDTERYNYNQTKFYVTTILPYVNIATQLFKDINEKAEDSNVSKKEFRQFVNGKEDMMRTQFEDKIRELNVTQGVLLVKLIARQTDLNIYKMLTEFKNPLVAIKWQAWSRMNGLNINKRYNPADEPVLENIMDELGYPLPASYSLKD